MFCACVLQAAQGGPSTSDSAGDGGAPVGSIRAAIDSISAGLVERGTEARLLLLAALAGEHVLFMGPPGTAKSELARRLHSCLKSSAYFERLLTRFSVPEEIFGPLSMRALEQDTYLRHTQGYLPDVRLPHCQPTKILIGAARRCARAYMHTFLVAAKVSRVHMCMLVLTCYAGGSCVH